MAESYQVETGCVEISDLLRKIAAEHDWKGLPSDSTRHTPWLLIRPARRSGGWNLSGFPNEHSTLTIPEAIHMLKEPQPPPPITIDGHTARFGECGISWGGVTVTTEVIDQIHKRLHAEDDTDD